MPPKQADPPPKSVVGNPANPGASVGFNWVLGGVPIPPFPHHGSKSGEEELVSRDSNGLRGVSTAAVRDTLVDHSWRDLSSDKMVQAGGFYPRSDEAY